ncbi:TonB-dependent receptor [Parazoarcus communis]|jgi:iron complex outermembrane receptor protein|uniref:TonB-dependent receptor n=1 Tax=Parazoarcus communis TaxID=41977 RepID=A0A2U8H5K8_9RHOO|nr:TonB-dependent receptor [Parazoarcus communis]AWI81247.1 TonB-dependent receptor [Parazoarcus communis]
MNVIDVKPTRLTLALAMAFCAPAALAQVVAGSETAPKLDEIVVSAPGLNPLPQTRGQMNQTDVAGKRTGTSDSASLLKDVEGVSLYGAGGVSSLPAIRGLADDRLRIKVDGMDLISACGNHMNPPLSYIDPSNVSSVQVFAGITPVSLGGDSIGGTILVDSPDPEFARPGEGNLLKGEIGAFYRSNGDATGANLSATFANESLSVSYRGSTAKADNYEAGGDFKAAGLAAAGRGWLDGDEVGSSAYETSNQSLAMGYRHENHLVELKLGVQDIPEQGWPNQRMDMTGNHSEQVNLSYKGTFDWGALEARAYNETTRHEMQFGDDKLYWYGPNNVPNSDGIAGPILPGMNGRAAGMPMDTKGNNTGVSLKADIVLSERDILRVGGDVQQYRLDDWWEASGKGMSPNTFWNIRNGERDRFAVFAEWEAAWTPQWLTQFGLRHETVSMDADTVQGYSPTFSATDEAAFNAADRSKTDQNLDVAALARYTPSSTQSYEFGYAQKTRSPNLYERYAWSTNGMAMRMINMAGDGNGYVGNLDLKPEVAHTVSATADWHDANRATWGLKVTPYFTYVDNYIDAERCSSGGASCTAANLTRTDGFVYLRFVNESARLYGVDVAGHMLLGTTQAMGVFTGKGSLSYVRGKNPTTGDNLYNMMPLNARLALEQKLGSWTNTVELELVADKDKVSATRNEVETAGYGLLHLRSSYEWKQLRFDVGVENVFDRFYNHPLGGAYLGQGKTMSGTDVAWGTLVPGVGRSIYAGVTVKF